LRTDENRDMIGQIRERHNIVTMTVQISCPECEHPVDFASRHCENCGVDLPLAAALAESAFASSIRVQSKGVIAPEVLVPRLGDTLIDKGVVSEEDLQSALEYQREKEKSGNPILIGQALVALNLIDRASLDEAITEQILQLQLALHRSNRQLEQRVLERTSDLQRALNKLTELNQLKSNFISNISHELRTPLTHLKGYLDILADQSLGPLTPQQGEALQVLKRAENRLERLIDDLIQFSLAAKGELSLRIQGVSLRELLSQVVTQAGTQAQSKEISIQVNISNDIPPVQADQEKVGWVLSQLIDNAIKFTPRGGQIGIVARFENNLASIAIQDTGIGIPPERISEIFEPFHQLDGSVTRRYAGTGLGLAMARRILEAHGSQLKVESTPEKGSIFEFSLLTTNNSHV
jgi:signal transduction histidine kinase